MTANHNAEGKRWEWTDREERYLERLEQFGRTPGMHWLLERLRAALGEIERLRGEVSAAEAAIGQALREGERLRGEVERLRPKQRSPEEIQQDRDDRFHDEEYA